MAALAAASLVSGRAPVDLTNGASPTAVTGDTFDNTGAEYLAIHNPEADTLTVSVDVPLTVDGLAVPDKAVTVPATKTMLVGPFPKNIYNDGTGKVTAICSFAAAGVLANVKLKVIKFA